MPRPAITPRPPLKWFDHSCVISKEAWRPLAAGAGFLAGLFLLVPATCLAGEGAEIVAVFARASDDYVRARQPDGAFQTETYTFGEGGLWKGASSDPTIDGLQFTKVARLIAGPLADQKYVPAFAPEKIKLLIMVYWGTTRGARDYTDSILLPYLQAETSPMTLRSLGTDSVGLATAPGDGTSPGASPFSDSALMMIGMTDRMRAFANRENAGILGYESKLTEMEALKNTPARLQRADLLEDIEYSRYFVVLMAYDFQLLSKEKRHRLLWETRFSIQERGNDFGRQLPGMAQFASRFFGRDSHGLQRKSFPAGRVDLGELKIIEIAPDK